VRALEKRSKRNTSWRSPLSLSTRLRWRGSTLFIWKLPRSQTCWADDSKQMLCQIYRDKHL